MSGLPNILLLFQIVGGIAETATNGNIVAQKIILFRKKTKETLDLSLGACFNFAADFEISRESLRHSG
jgi:hypothetical protein